MTFISRTLQAKALTYGFCLCAALWLSGCTFVPHKSAPQADASAGVSEPEEPQSVNPYTENRKSVAKPAQERFTAATRAMAGKNWAQAEQHLLWVVDQYPRYSGPYLNLAIVYQQLGKVADAESAFRGAIQANKGNLDARNQFAIFLREQGRFKEAEAQYLNALSQWSKHPETHYNLAILYDLYMGRWDEALQHYQRYQAVKSDSAPKVAAWIADLQRRIGQLAANK